MSSFLQNFHALYVYQVFHNISGDGGNLHIEIQTNKFKRWILCFLKTLGFSDMVPRHSQHPHSLLPFQANNHDSRKKQLKNIPPNIWMPEKFNLSSPNTHKLSSRATQTRWSRNDYLYSLMDLFIGDFFFSQSSSEGRGTFSPLVTYIMEFL